ncbi:transmembrane protein 186 [Sitodiplosis mosellana]|uniref:transmembrane protein 186 n=1 Tax=Sitodiplosis mosellana TaxID=263140 RepID=UPI0024442FA6|nr:transmembrane protein 186 [Sitodiplosis mosellana]
MIRIAGAQLYKINSHPNHTFHSVRTVCVNSYVQLNRSKAEELAEKKRKDKDMRWTKLYYFKDIKYHAIVTRLKIYPYLSTVLLTPITYLVELSQHFPDFSATPCLMIGLTGSTILSAYSKALANTIGIVYICGQNKNLQITYIDFWGKQQFIQTTVDDVPKWPKSPVKFGLYKTVQAIDGKEEKSLKLPWKGVDIFDIKLFRRLFGK